MSGQGSLIAGYHGDPSRQHRFWIYPNNCPLQTSRWDTHLEPNTFCTNCVISPNKPAGELKEYICRGHPNLETIESNFSRNVRRPHKPVEQEAKISEPENLIEQCGKGMLVDGYHGDPARNHGFWVYERRKHLITPRWDTHLTADEFCTNNVFQCMIDAQVHQFACRGHSLPIIMTPAVSASLPAVETTEHSSSSTPTSLLPVVTLTTRAASILSELKDMGFEESYSLPTLQHTAEASSTTEQAVDKLLSREPAEHHHHHGHNADVATAHRSMHGKNTQSAPAIEPVMTISPSAGGISGIPVEYLPARQLMIIAPEIMGTSPQSSTYKQLTTYWAAHAQKAGTGVLFDDICVRAIRIVCNINPTLGNHLDSTASVSTSTSAIRNAHKATGDELQQANRLNAAAKAYIEHIPEVTTNCANFYQSALTFHSQMDSWRRQVLCQAMLFLTDLVDDPDITSEAITSLTTQERSDLAFKLKMMFGYMQRGVSQCEARRWWVFSEIINICTQQFAVLNARNVDHTANGANSAYKLAYTRLRSALIATIEEYKEKAFRTVFIEPSIAYFDETRNPVMSGDVEVHGANLYLAVLDAVLGKLFIIL